MWFWGLGFRVLGTLRAKPKRCAVVHCTVTTRSDTWGSFWPRQTTPALGTHELLSVICHQICIRNASEKHQKCSLDPQVLEKARIAKLLGSALEARVLLHVADGELRSRLAALDASDNGADPLRYAFIVSEVRSLSSPVVTQHTKVNVLESCSDNAFDNAAATYEPGT